MIYILEWRGSSTPGKGRRANGLTKKTILKIFFSVAGSSTSDLQSPVAPTNSLRPPILTSNHICGCFFLLPPLLSPRTEKRKNSSGQARTAAVPWSHPWRLRRRLGWGRRPSRHRPMPSCARTSSSRSTLTAFSFPVRFPLRLLLRELLLCNCKMGMRFPISVSCCWGECSSSYAVTICAMDTIFCFD